MVDQTELTLSKLNSGASGPLRVVVECHTCFDWLMPAMDVYRQRWPDAELDIVSGFHADPVGLLHDGQAELAIVSESVDEPGVSVHPLFSFEMMAVVPAGRRSRFILEYQSPSTMAPACWRSSREDFLESRPLGLVILPSSFL